MVPRLAGRGNGDSGMKDLRHPFVHDPAEGKDFCLCGDVEWVHKPDTLLRFLRRWFSLLEYWLLYSR